MADSPISLAALEVLAALLDALGSGGQQSYVHLGRRADYVQVIPNSLRAESGWSHLAVLVRNGSVVVSSALQGMLPGLSFRPRTASAGDTIRQIGGTVGKHHVGLSHAEIVEDCGSIRAFAELVAPPYKSLKGKP